MQEFVIFQIVSFILISFWCLKIVVSHVFNRPKSFNYFISYNTGNDFQTYSTVITFSHKINDAWSFKQAVAEVKSQVSCLHYSSVNNLRITNLQLLLAQ